MLDSTACDVVLMYLAKYSVMIRNKVKSTATANPADNGSGWPNWPIEKKTEDVNSVSARPGLRESARNSRK